MPPLPLRAIFIEQNKKRCYMETNTKKFDISDITETEMEVLRMLYYLEGMSADTWLKAKAMSEALAREQGRNMEEFTQILFRFSARDRKRSGIH